MVKLENYRISVIHKGLILVFKSNPAVQLKY